MGNDLVERLEQAAMENEVASWQRQDIHSLGIGANLCREAAARIEALERECDEAREAALEKAAKVCDESLAEARGWAKQQTNSKG